MRRRDKIRTLLRGSRDPSPLPPDPPTSSPLPNATPTSSGKTNYNNAPGVAAGQNQALQRAIEDHIAQIPLEEKQWFRSVAHNMTDDSVLESVRMHDQSHRAQSCLRSRTELLSQILQGIGRFTDAIAIGIQANPDVSSIIVGIVRGVITIAIGFTSFFDKLTEMMNRMVEFLDPLTSYAQPAKTSPVVEDCLVAVYIDLLTFFRSARRVFVDNQGHTRKWTSWRVFWRIQWVPFQDEFGTVEERMRHHRDLLKHAAQADILGKSAESSRNELARQQREMCEFSVPMREGWWY